MTPQPSPEVDYTAFDLDTLKVLEAYAVQNLKSYYGFQEQLETMDLPEHLKPLVPRNILCIRECEMRLEMIRKALSTIH